MGIGMEKITIWFSEEEIVLLNDCTTLTTLKSFPLLRGLLMQSLEELQKEIEEKGSITCSFPVRNLQEAKKKRIVKTIPVRKEVKDGYDAVLSRIPVQRAEFLKLLLLPKLEKIQSKKMRMEEVIA